jgi:hypothetical protein
MVLDALGVRLVTRVEVEPMGVGRTAARKVAPDAKRPGR